MDMKKLEWDDLSCEVSQEYIDRGFALVEGAAPWVCVDADEDLRITVTESWLCNKTEQWMFTDIDLKADDLLWRYLECSKETGTLEEHEAEKNGLVASLQKLIKKIESF